MNEYDVVFRKQTKRLKLYNKIELNYDVFTNHRSKFQTKKHLIFVKKSYQNRCALVPRVLWLLHKISRNVVLVRLLWPLFDLTTGPLIKSWKILTARIFLIFLIWRFGPIVNSERDQSNLAIIFELKSEGMNLLCIYSIVSKWHLTCVFAVHDSSIKDRLDIEIYDKDLHIKLLITLRTLFYLFPPKNVCDTFTYPLKLYNDLIIWKRGANKCQKTKKTNRNHTESSCFYMAALHK